MAEMQESQLSIDRREATYATPEITGFAGSGSRKQEKMSVYETTPRPLPLGTITTHRVVSAIESLLADVRAWRAARATASALRDLSDAQLADIGLHRGAIPNVAGTLARR